MRQSSALLAAAGSVAVTAVCRLGFGKVWGFLGSLVCPRYHRIEHRHLNLEEGSREPTFWINLGYWEDDHGSYRQAAEALCNKVKSSLIEVFRFCFWCAWNK